MISIPHLKMFEARLESLSRSNADALAAYHAGLARLKNRDADAEVLYQQQLCKVDLASHRELLMLARGLTILANPPDSHGGAQAGGVIVPPKVLELRREIDEAERKRIAELLAGRSFLVADERIEKAIYRKEMSLDALFEREASRPLREMENARRAITREKKLRAPDRAKITALEKQMESARQAVDQLVPAYFGHPARAGFGYETDWPADHAAEVLRVRILKCAGGISARIAEHSEKGGENGGAYGEIGGTSIYSENLGVVLDVSGSMRSFIEPLKKEIAKSFSGPRYRQVTGCALGIPPRSGSPPMVDVSRDTLAVVEELITVHKVDTIYWFCDLQDTRSVGALRRLRHLLRRGGVEFHIKSVDRQPDRELEPLITSFKR